MLETIAETVELEKSEANMKLLESKFVNIFQEQSQIFVTDGIIELFKNSCLAFFSEDEELCGDFED